MNEELIRQMVEYGDSIKDKVEDSLLDRDADAPIELTADEARWLLGVLKQEDQQTANDELSKQIARLTADLAKQKRANNELGERFDKILTDHLATIKLQAATLRATETTLLAERDQLRFILRKIIDDASPCTTAGNLMVDHELIRQAEEVLQGARQ